MDHRVVESIRRGQAEMQDRTLADLLVERGLLSRAETTALTADTPPGSLAERLLSEERLSSDQLEALSEEMNLLESLDTAVQDVTPGEVRRAAREPSSRIGKYVLVDKLGAGGMGEVWRAWDYGLGRWVALKFLKVDDSRLVSRFMREATLLARLAHPNITQVFEVGVHDGRPYLAMELVDGGSFGREPLERRAAAEVIRDAGRGVAHAHAKGIVHRDLKPSNLLRSSDGRIFVTDFGLARMRAEEGGLTVSGALLGTPSFMAPEQAQGRDADERTDIYGLGATLYALVEGKPPFAGEAAAEIVRRAATAPPPSLSGDRDDLTVVALKAMERDRRDRYQSVQELVDDLDRYLADEPVAAQPISTISRVWRKARRRPLYSSSVVAASLLIAGAAIWAGGRINDFRLRTLADRMLGSVTPLETEYRRYVDAADADSAEARRLVEEMRPAIERAAAVAPDYERSIYYRGRLANWSGEQQAAEETFGRLLARDPSHHEARVARARNRLSLATREGWEPDPEVTSSMQGVEYGYTPPPPAAAEWIAGAREDYQALPDGHEEKAAGLGMVAFFEGDYDTCSELIDPVIGERPYLNEARRMLLWCQLGVGRYEDAESQANHFVGKGIFTQFATELRAYARAGQGRFDEAIADLEWLRSNDPSRRSVFIPFWMMLAGRYDESLVEYDRMLAAEPDQVQLLLDRAKVYQQLGELDKALADADRAIELDPDNPESHYQRALALTPSEEALVAYGRAIELDPESVVYRGQRSFTHLQLENWAAAIADATFAAGREPEYSGWSWSLGMAHAWNGDHEQADRYLSRALEGMDPDGLTLYWRGLSRLHLDNCPGAVKDFVVAGFLGQEFPDSSWDLARETCGAEVVAGERQAAEAALAGAGE